MSVHQSSGNTTRRGFLAAGGAGLFVFFTAKPSRAIELPRESYATDWNAYLRVGPGARVTCFTGKAELGQGTTTSLAQIVAEELDVSFDNVDVVMADSAVCPWDYGTVGSLSIWQFSPILRRALAEARAVLLEMASERLHVPAGQLRAGDGVIFDPAAPSNRVAYGELTAGKRVERHIHGTRPKTAPKRRVEGQSPQRKDAMVKVTGQARYAADALPPGLLYARLVRPPVLGARLKSADTSQAEKMPGVRVIRDGDMVAILHPRPDGADDALRLVKADFEIPGGGPDDKTIFDHLVSHAPRSVLAGEDGDLAAGEKLAVRVLANRYKTAYISHALMETHSATASVEGSHATVWASAQNPSRSRREVAQALDLPLENVRLVASFVGGGFGGKCYGTQWVEAARLSRLAGKPVQVVLDRAEEFRLTRSSPAAALDIRAGLTAEGKLAFWDSKAYGCGPQTQQPFYDVPHHLGLAYGSWDISANPPGYHPLGVGVWRGPAGYSQSFARESHMDVLAAAAGIDPVEFRLRNLSDPRMRRVLETAASKFGWQPAKGPTGRGFGIACGVYTFTYSGVAAEVAVDRKSGRIQVRRIVFAHDQGPTVSPEGTRQQVEGAIIMGIGHALSEEIRFKGGDVLVKNFDSYDLPRFSSLPRIEIELIDTPNVISTGCGEPPVINVAAAIANAVHDALGVRLFQLPMTPERVLAALAASAH